MATSGDRYLATSGDFFMATDSENVASPAGLRQAVGRLRAGVDRRWPVAVAVDQEGGLVQRVQGGMTRLPAFMSAGAAGRADLTRAAYDAAGRELTWLGVDLVLAPDTDVTSGPADPVIGSRSAGSDPGVVARQGVAAARGFRDAGLVPVVKHFPGHGSLTTDSHLALPVQAKTRAALWRSDLVPFRAPVEAGLPAVMVGHIAVRAYDPGVPATVSPAVIDGLLRERLGFGGLVVSDALEMAALDGTRAPAVGFLRAGGDVVLMPPDPAATRDAIVSAVRHGTLQRTRLVQAAARMVALLRHQQHSRHDAPTRPGSAAPAVRRLSAAAVTVAAGPCRGPLVRGRVVPLGEAPAVAAFRAAAHAAHLPLGKVVRRGKRHPRRVVVGTPVHLVGAGGTAPDDGVVVTTDAPYALAGSGARVRIAAYGEGRPTMAAVVAVLQGRRRAPGHLPVPVAGVPRRGC